MRTRENQDARLRPPNVQFMSWLGAPTPISAATAAATLPSSLRHRARNTAGGSDANGNGNGNARSARTTSGSGPSSPTILSGSAATSPTAGASTPLAARTRARRKHNKGSNTAPTRLRDRLNRGLVQAAFKQFGEHCARNQVRWPDVGDREEWAERGALGHRGLVLSDIYSGACASESW